MQKGSLAICAIKSWRPKLNFKNIYRFVERTIQKSAQCQSNASTAKRNFRLTVRKTNDHFESFKFNLIFLFQPKFFIVVLSLTRPAVKRSIFQNSIHSPVNFAKIYFNPNTILRFTKANACRIPNLSEIIVCDVTRNSRA